jgi:RimJ/RimL family protein N-acetyltransferase
MDGAFSLTTERLVIRPLAPPDVDEFVRYRNIDAVARYQDWSLPYTVEMAIDLIKADGDGGPHRGGWVQLAIDHAGKIVGDFAVWIDDDGALASLGYTVAPEHQGHNYAVEATAAVVEWLFTEVGVHRITATLDPRNIASARVLERSGFEYEGTDRSAALIRGAWEDDTRFSLLVDDWPVWRDRPTSPPSQLAFVEVTADNVREVGRIEVALSQRRFVAGVTESIAEAAHPPVVDGVTTRPWYRAIEADGHIVGFMMVTLPTTAEPVPRIWRLLVDTWHQRRGIARRAIGLLAEQLVADGCESLDVRFIDEFDGPEAFYAEFGFTRTGRVDADGTVWSRANLEGILDRLRA